MLNDFLITRDVLSYLRLFLERNELRFPLLEEKLEVLALKKFISYEQWWSLLEELEQYCDQPSLGLNIGRHIQAKDCGVLGYLFKTSRNVGDALKCFNRFQALIYAGSEAKLEIDKNQTVSLIWEPVHGYSSQTSDALLISGMINILRELIMPKTFELKAIHFTQAISVEDLRQYEAFFNCEVCECKAKLSIQFTKHQLLIEIPHVDTTLNYILGQQAEILLTRLPDNDNFLVLLRDTVLRCLHEGQSDASKVAKIMGLSERTFHRRLKSKNKVYRDVLKDIRKSMSINYLEDEKLSMPEISLLLGYSEQSTFSRAFKQWYGMPPHKYKKMYLN